MEIEILVFKKGRSYMNNGFELSLALLIFHNIKNFSQQIKQDFEIYTLSNYKTKTNRII